MAPRLKSCAVHSNLMSVANGTSARFGDRKQPEELTLMPGPEVPTVSRKCLAYLMTTVCESCRNCMKLLVEVVLRNQVWGRACAGVW